MDNIRGSLSDFKKDIKQQLGRIKRKGDKLGLGGRDRNVGSSSSFPQPESRVSMGEGSERGGDGPDTENENAGASTVNRPGWGSTASSSAKLLLRGVRDSADAFGPLKSVAGGLCFILENYERTKANKQAIESLAPRVKELAERLCKPVREGDVEEQERRARLERELQEVLRDLAPLERQGNVEGFFNNTENAAQLGGLVESIRDAMMEYQTSLQQGIYAKTQDIDEKVMESADLNLLNRLYHAANAGYLCGNRQGCLKGTREEVLRDIDEWLAKKRGQRVFWLNGLAGTGKSTIAQSFAETTFESGKLGASFFCSRDFEDRSNLQMIFPTLAFQLACRYPRFRKMLLKVLKKHPDAGHESLCSQMEKLLVGPLKASGLSTLIIIDALDECKDKEPASALLSILSRYVDQIPTIKFFITGRPEPRIRSGFRLKALVPITEVFKLHEVKPEAVDRDIELFFRTQLASLVSNRSDFDLTEDWPSPFDLGVLCKKAAGFFIYASTVVKFVASELDSPPERLSLIISLPQSTIEEGKSGVDQLYTQILQQAFGGIDSGNSQRYLRFQTVVGAVLLLFNPLSIKDLSDLLGCSTQYIQNSIRSLHSLLLVPGSIEDPIRIFHKSFSDFIMDPGRCEDEKFVVEPAAHHAEILLACLRLMDQRLKKNICSLGDYAVLSEVKARSTYKKDQIGGGLEYACKYWTKHLLEIPGGSSHAEEIHKTIKGFFTVHLLHWFEALVITENLGVGVHAMNDIEHWYNLDKVVSEWANDGKRFLLEHFDTIKNSPSHIYHSALPLAPSTSWIYKQYISEASGAVKVVKGAPTGWGECSRTILLGSPQCTLSHHNNSIAVGSESGDIIILNAITGNPSAVLSGHTGYVSSVVFSQDGTLLVSGSYDETVKLWDVQTGGVAKNFFGYGKVPSVSISADLTTIASGFDDRRICLWSIHTGECYYTIWQHAWVDYVMFSPKDPHHLISVSSNRLRQWSANGCQIRSSFDSEHVAFSSDGAQFVSCYQNTITVYNSSSEAVVTRFQTAHGVDRCCFSPHSTLVAVAIKNTAYCWNITTSKPQLVETFVGHTGTIESLAFSSPTTLVSASRDCSVKFWQIRAQAENSLEVDPKPASLSSTPTYFIVLKSKQSLAFTFHTDHTMKAWDTSTGICRTSFQVPDLKRFRKDAQLVDGRFTVVWYEEGHIWVLDGENEKSKLASGRPWARDLKISGDGSMVFALDKTSISAWSLQTREAIGEVKIKGSGDRSLVVDGSNVWVFIPPSKYKGWDFGIQGSVPVKLSNKSTPPSVRVQWNTRKVGIKNSVTGETVFQLSGRFANPVDVRSDDLYLVASYPSGEILILDLTNVK